MSKIIRLPLKQALTVEKAAEIQPEELTREEMLLLIPKIEALYDALQEEEPGDIMSEEYLAWEEDLEVLDDLLDEIQDLLEE